MSKFLGKAGKVLHGIILNFIIAGKVTTTTTLSCSIYVLRKYPPEKEVQEIKKEIYDKQDAPDIMDCGVNVSEHALEKMHYLHATLIETLRLYPTIPMIKRTSFIVYIRGHLTRWIQFNIGDINACQSYLMGRMKFIWGDDVEEYKSERWIDGDGFFKPKNHFKFTASQVAQTTLLALIIIS